MENLNKDMAGRETKIKEAQKKAKDIGHCLCDLQKKCPCDNFIETGNCECANSSVK